MGNNKLDKQQFLEKYRLEDVYKESDCGWDDLNHIYVDYIENYFDKYSELADKIVKCLKMKSPDGIRAIYGRAKHPEHLLEKIIRKKEQEHKEKYENISVENYRDIITDLIGVRILVLAKEEWKEAFSLIDSLFDEFFEGTPIAYVCYGDREIFNQRIIKVDYTNKGYRSQHYVVKFQDVFCEIQVRTLAEEVYGEFDHRIRYPYRMQNKFLVRYGKIVSKCTAELDELVSSCLDMGEKSWESLDEKFCEDQYVDWHKQIFENEALKAEERKQDEAIDARTLANTIIIRK